MADKIRVLIVDDHPLMRDALRAAIEDEADMEVVGEAVDGHSAVAQARTLTPDVAVMDLFMPGASGVEAMACLRREGPAVHFLALTSANEPEILASAIEAGARGFLTKDSTREEILHAIRQVSRGNAFFPPRIAGQLAELAQARRAEANTRGPEKLTERERDVLKWIGRGASNKQIAEQLSLTESTVRTHLQHLLDKLGLENRNQAVLFANERMRWVKAGEKAGEKASAIHKPLP